MTLKEVSRVGYYPIVVRNASRQFVLDIFVTRFCSIYVKQYFALIRRIVIINIIVSFLRSLHFPTERRYRAVFRINKR